MCLIDYLLVFTQKFFIIKRRKDYDSNSIRNCSRVGDNEVLQQQTYIHCILRKIFHYCIITFPMLMKVYLNDE